MRGTILALYPVWKSPGCGGANGVNSQRYGLMSSSGVSSRQSRPRTRTVAPSTPTSLTIEVPIGFGRTGERNEKVPWVESLLFGALQHDVAARLVQPIEHFEVRVEVDAFQRHNPWLEDFKPADRAIMPSLPRRCQPRRPRCADAADKDQAGVLRRRHIDDEFAFADFTFSNHAQIQKCCVSTTTNRPGVDPAPWRPTLPDPESWARPPRSFLDHPRKFMFRNTKQAPPARRMRLQRSSASGRVSAPIRT